MNERISQAARSQGWHEDDSGVFTREVPLEERKINVEFAIGVIKNFTVAGEVITALVTYEAVLKSLESNGRFEAAQQLRDAIKKE